MRLPPVSRLDFTPSLLVNSESGRCVPLAGVGGWWSWLHNGENYPQTQEGGSHVKHLKLGVHYSQDPWLVCLCPEKDRCSPRGCLFEAWVAGVKRVCTAGSPPPRSSLKLGQSQVLSSRNVTESQAGSLLLPGLPSRPPAVIQLPRSVTKLLAHPPFPGL